MYKELAKIAAILLVIVIVALAFIYLVNDNTKLKLENQNLALNNAIVLATLEEQNATIKKNEIDIEKGIKKHNQLVKELNKKEKVKSNECEDIKKSIDMYRNNSL